MLYSQTMIRQLLLVISISLLSLFQGNAQSPNVASLPAGWNEGINVLSSSSVGLVIYAPNKAYSYVKGDFNNWQIQVSGLMNITPDGDYHWIQLSGLNSTTEYRYQYVVGSQGLEFADPYAEKILDPWNDVWIPSSTYPNLISYPSQANWPVSVFQITQSSYSWNDAGFSRPARNRLNIYELLIRDFSTERNFQAVIDKLDYLETLGINCIELMPVFEFDGNESWGYNPNFWFAPDKYYGTKNKFKELVDAAHQRGISVVLDVVFNHSWGLNPQVRMYNEDPNGFGAVTAENPWLNTIATHDYNVGTDYNHESSQTRSFVKRALSHWISEYHIDGYRFDLSKGFTQNNTLGDVNAWGAYDQSRIDILNDYASHVWNEDSEIYMILEHLGDNDEEQVLAQNGFLLWGAMNHNYSEAAMGYASDLSWASHQTRGFAYANLIAYMESHDEERMMWKCKQYGNSSGGYDITNENTALERMKLCNAFYLTLPGPKMIWQFGELGYDVSINDCGNGTVNSSCRLNNRPVLWNYYDEPDRQSLYDFVSTLNQLRLDYDAMHTSNFAIDLGGFQKRINLYGSEFNMVIIGNFDVTASSKDPNFPHPGTWYELNSSNTISVTDLNAQIGLSAGEYKIYTDIELGNTDPTPVLGCTDSNANNFNALAETDDGTCLYTLSFQLETTGISVSGDGIHLAGSFQGWSPSSSPMTEISPNHWETSIEVLAGQSITYKYINGNQWGLEEEVPAECGISNGFGGFDREWVTSSNNESISSHCFASCEPCVIDEVLITFRVDLSNESVSGNGVHIAGNFQSWNPGATSLSNSGGSIYEYSATFIPGSSLEYKFINGNVWGEDESVPSECATGANRELLVGSDNIVLELVCFNSCTACASTSCPGDFNSDSQRNISDLLYILSEIGCNVSCTTDLNNDGQVNTGDMLLFLSLFGISCE